MGIQYCFVFCWLLYGFVLQNWPALRGLTFCMHFCLHNHPPSIKICVAFNAASVHACTLATPFNNNFFFAVFFPSLSSSSSSQSLSHHPFSLLVFSSSSPVLSCPLFFFTLSHKACSACLNLCWLCLQAMPRRRRRRS